MNATAFELEKQLISDALRNAAMRFGVALDLWAKETLTAPQAAPSIPEGWDTAEHAQEAHRSLRERIAALSEDEREQVRSIAPGWPLARIDYDRVLSTVVLYEANDEPF